MTWQATALIINRELLAKAEEMDSPQRVALDMDSTGIPVCAGCGKTHSVCHSEGWGLAHVISPKTTLSFRGLGSGPRNLSVGLGQIEEKPKRDSSLRSE